MPCRVTNSSPGATAMWKFLVALITSDTIKVGMLFGADVESRGDSACHVFLVPTRCSAQVNASTGVGFA